MNRDFFDALSASLKEAVSMAKDANILPADSGVSGQDASPVREEVRPEYALDQQLEDITSENRPSAVGTDVRTA